MLNHSLVPVGSTGYDIDNSLRFNDDDSAYLSRTPSSAGNRKTWTWSGWVKKGNSTAGRLFSIGDFSGYNGTTIFWEYGKLGFLQDIVGSLQYDESDAQFRDYSAWYHIVVSVDTTQATSTNRVKMYINGSQISTTNTYGYMAQNQDTMVNATVEHNIGARHAYYSSNYLDGYLAEVNFVDGQALTPSDFGETDETYGHWKPIKYTGTYGTNGFYLDFKNSGSLGNDASSNSNNWTPNNLAATDQMLDSPTNNFCTWNSADNYNCPLSEGNLRTTSLAGYNMVFGTQPFSSGKYYWEQLVESSTVSLAGVANTSVVPSKRSTNLGGSADSVGYYKTGVFYYNNVLNASGYATFANGDIIGIACDMSAKTVTWYKNNTSIRTMTFSAWDDMTPAWTIGSGAAGNSDVSNFGQDSSFAGNKTAQGNADDNGYGDFYYTPPTGFLALCTQNLPEPTVVPSEHFNTVLWSGNSSTQSITGVGFAPDLPWIKCRNSAQSHRLNDTVRGVAKTLFSDGTGAEATDETDGLTSFDSDGFSLGASGAYNQSGRTYVAWNWKANGTGVSNTNGSITSTVSANVDAGFSIVSYTGNGTSGATIGHGLSSAPELIIYKSRTTAQWWGVKPASISGVLFLNNTYAETTNTFVNSMSSSVINMTNDTSINDNTVPFIAYAFHSVEGYSKVGSYTGNGSSDGTFVHTSFKPKYIMLKRTDSADSWAIFDTERSTYNVIDDHLRADSSGAEYSPGGSPAVQLDALSNGFKHREGNGQVNANGGSYIFIAFAEVPFKYSTGV